MQIVLIYGFLKKNGFLAPPNELKSGHSIEKLPKCFPSESLYTLLLTYRRVSFQVFFR